MLGSDADALRPGGGDEILLNEVIPGGHTSGGRRQNVGEASLEKKWMQS